MSLIRKHRNDKQKTQAKKQLAQAKKMIQAKKYEDARAILITIDHAIADKWLERLPKPQAKTNETTSKQWIQGCLIFIVLFLVCGVIFGTFFADDRTEYDVQVACTIANDLGMYCNPEQIMNVWPQVAQKCHEDHKPSTDQEYSVFILCLQNNGVTTLQ
jgi:hypothetical protein